MIDLDGIIRKRETVSLKKQHIAAVNRLYSESVIKDTLVEKITYLSTGLHINGYIARPKAKGKFPVLIWNRGGSSDKGALDDLTAYLILASTAEWGYVVLGTQYRGNMGSEGDEDWGGEDLTDVLNLIKVAENLPECDTDRIAVEGASRGGMVTYRALLRYDKFKCAIVHAGITDVPALMRAKPEFRDFLDDRYAHLNPEERHMELQNVSAVHFADKISPDIPILIMHGTADSVVPIEQSITLAVKLKELNHPHKFVKIQGGTHVALKDGSYREIDHHRRSWLKKYLE